LVKRGRKGGGRGEKDEGEKRRVVYGPRITGKGGEDIEGKQKVAV
jgi:hypothetical protein